MTYPAPRYVGSPDFHDGYVRGVSFRNNGLQVAVEGDTGKKYLVSFAGVAGVEFLTPQDMMLYALSEADTDKESLRRYDFVNWYVGVPDEPKAKAYLRILAAGFTVTPGASLPT